MEQSGLSTSRWLDAIWEPNTRLHTLPNGIDMLDLSGDGDSKLIVVDLGNNALDNIKLRIFKGADQTADLTMVDLPCAVIGFHTENVEKKSAAIAVGICSNIFIFKNLKPYFKFSLPEVSAHPKEQDVWYKAGADDELNIFTLVNHLKLLLKEIGAAYLSSRSLKFLSLKREFRKNFLEQFRKLPLIKMNAVTSMGMIRKDSWTKIASNYLIVGTELGEILILDHRSFFIIEKYIIGWPPINITSSGLWAGDGKIIIVGRDGKIGAIQRGNIFKSWEKLSAPAVAVAMLSYEEVAIITMNGLFFAFSKQGVKLWKIQLPGYPLDMVSLPVPPCDLSLMAVSIAGLGVRIYDQKHHVDTINVLESISSLKYGQLGQEERTMAMITYSGGLNIKILKRTADFNKFSYLQTNLNPSNDFLKFIIPKKNTLFIEHTIRGRSDNIKIHKIFQQSFLRLRLNIATRIKKTWINEYEFGLSPITLQSSIYGLGPNYIIKIYITSVFESLLTSNIFLVCRNNNILIKPRVVNLPNLAAGITIPIIISVSIKDSLSNKIQILLCYKREVKPLSVININIPVTEDKIDI